MKRCQKCCYTVCLQVFAVILKNIVSRYERGYYNKWSRILFSFDITLYILWSDVFQCSVCIYFQVISFSVEEKFCSLFEPVIFCVCEYFIQIAYSAFVFLVFTEDRWPHNCEECSINNGRSWSCGCKSFIFVIFVIVHSNVNGFGYW